jgi:alpha-tubulin suppressor-like RCC1 family protein
MNEKGQLGLGDTNNRQTPTIINDLKHLNILEISCGFSHMLCLTIAGKTRFEIEKKFTQTDDQENEQTNK